MIVCKSQAELEKMNRAGLVIWEVLNDLRAMAKPGVSTKDLDEFAERRTAELKVRPAFKNYRGYPATLCTSINSEVVHGIPSKSRRLQDGDIISLDFGTEYAGYYADAAVTVPVGEISPELKKLLQVTRESLDLPRFRKCEWATDCPTFRLPSRTGSSERTDIRWCGTCAVTESARIFTRSPTCSITANPAGDRACRKAWSSPSSRW